MRLQFNKITSAITLIVLSPAIAIAAQTAATAKEGTESFNAMLVGLVSLVFILLFAILILGNTLRQLAMVYGDKMRKEKASGIVSTVVLFILAMSMFATDAQAAEPAAQEKAVTSAFIDGI